MESLREWLASTGTTQSALAKQLGVSQPTISDWTRGSTFPDVENLRQLSAITGLSFDDLIGTEPPRQPASSVSAA